MNTAVEMEECITVRVPRGTSLALERAAIGAHARPGQLARRMLLDGLRASGFELASSRRAWRREASVSDNAQCLRSYWKPVGAMQRS